KLEIPEGASRTILPGHLKPDLEKINDAVGQTLECGPRDIRDLPLFFGGKSAEREGYGRYDIEIIAEINHADRLSAEQLLNRAQALAAQGANVIDLGCSPGHRWNGIGDAVKRLCDEGLRVSVDSFDVNEVASACRSGAELVLSVNSSNRQQASDWDTEVVVIPDTPDDFRSFEETINVLEDAGVRHRLDPILEPIGCGFAVSLQRYADCRRRWPNARMMMGIGNITELTDVDSAGLNVVLLGICQELGIQSVLTTEVINWARSSVRECDRARRLVHYAQTNGRPPKRVEPSLVMLRDDRVTEYPTSVLDQMASEIRDKNIRLFVAGGCLHAVSAGVHVSAPEPFALMEALLASKVGDSIDRSHAFYLGVEMQKALIALTLSKQYDQDRALRWGLLTVEEESHRLLRDGASKSDQ
ncbi:MAG TPA: dihydropteroate synthase, partial [Planctomycetaceae bacterium]|nr:dihydropteroate synthase [Planctomycetaceae bacterium]